MTWETSRVRLMKMESATTEPTSGGASVIATAAWAKVIAISQWMSAICTVDQTDEWSLYIGNRVIRIMSGCDHEQWK